MHDAQGTLLDAHKLRVVLAERLVRLELHHDGFAGAFALEGLLECLEHLAVAAVQVGELRGRGELDALRVVQLHAHRDDGVVAYERRRFTTSKTSAA